MGLGGLVDNIFGGGKDKEPEPIKPPAAPNPAAILADEKKKQQQKLAKRTKTVFTSPLGTVGQANTEQKGLLGA